jgi:rare lipoprotein A
VTRPLSQRPRSQTRVAACLFLTLIVSLLAACGGHKPIQVRVPAPPPLTQPAQPQQPAPPAAPAEAQTPSEGEKLEVPPDAKPIAEETGMASWYGPPYHNRRGSNGEVYNMHAMTAAHRTLPLGSIVRVTNEKTGHSTLVRITDRGPFIEGRILDLSLAAARAVDVYGPGVAKVHMEVLQVPAPLDRGGRWAVQIGAFADEKGAAKLADHLQRRYRTANVLRFSSPTGDWWVRVRVLDDDRERAQSLARETETDEGAVFLVRLD